MRFDNPDAFWTFADRVGPCLLWRGSKVQPSGYGYVFWRGRNARTHRVAWEIANGKPVPHRSSGLVVLHSCDQPACIEPTHLSLGTQADNMGQMKARGRARHGSSAKLVGSQVEAIRLALAAGESQTSVAARYRVTQACVSHIATGKTWSR